MGRRAVLVAAAGIALVLYASRPANFFAPLGPRVAAAGAQHGLATAGPPGAWTPRSDSRNPAKMTIMDREAVDEAKKGLFGRPGPSGFKDKADPYDTDLAKERLKKEQQMLDNLLHLKDQLEQELPFMFLRDLDPSYFAKDVVFKEPHLPPIRGRASYQLFLRGLKDAGNLLFEDPGFGVVRATHHEKDGLVKVRWKISGKYKAPFNLFQSSQGCFDGISYYYVEGSSGLVSVHQVDYHIPILPPVVREQNAFVWLDKAFAGVPAPSVPACGT